MGAGLGLIGWTAVGFAQPTARPRVRFTYARASGAEGCPPAENVRDAVAARLGYVPFDDRAASRVDVRVEGVGRGLRARVTWLDADDRTLGERELSARAGQCAALIEQAALTMSLAIEALPAPTVSSSVPSVTDVAPAPPVPPSTGGTRVTVIDVVTETTLRPRATEPARAEGTAAPRVVVSGALGGAVVLGSQPSPTLAVTLELGVRWRRVALAVEGRLDAAVTAVTGAGASVSTERRGVTVLPCGWWSLGSGPVAFGGCAVAAFGWLSGRGANVAMPREDQTWVFSVGGRGVLSFAVARWIDLRLWAEIDAAVRRGVVRIDGAVAWEELPVVGAVGAGLAVRIP